jgi:CelD/BcsL family acetyltransferase involved in cellulose biosynthesis
VPPELAVEIRPLSICPVVFLPCSMRAYLKRLNPTHRRKTQKGLRRLEELGPVTLERAEENTLPAFMTDFFRLHHALWKSRGEEGLLMGEEMQSFHREAASSLLHAGWLRFYRMIADGRPVAYVYGFEHRRRFYSYLGAFDPELERYSPGGGILMLVIEQCIREQVREFDFLRGEEEYKYLWDAKDTFTYQFYMRPRTPLVKTNG